MGDVGSRMWCCGEGVSDVGSGVRGCDVVYIRGRSLLD